MMENVFGAFVYGGIGAGVGAAIGTLIAERFKASGQARLIKIALPTALAVLGLNFAKPLLEPYIGKYLPAPKSASGSDLESQLRAGFAEANDPMMNAIIAREPQLIGQLSIELEEVVLGANSPQNARAMAFAAASNKVVGRLTHYMKRATDDDLVSFGKIMVESLGILSERDARFCYNYLYNPGALTGFQVQDFREKFGGDQFNRQQAVAGKLVENADDEPPAYDAEVGGAGVQRAAAVLQEMLGPDGMPMISGGRLPKDDAEAKLACDASAAMYQSMVAEEDAATVLRHLFTLSG